MPGPPMIPFDQIVVLIVAIVAAVGVITFAFEHHANLLPWRGRRFRHLPIPPGPEEMLEALEMALEDEPARRPVAQHPVAAALQGAGAEVRIRRLIDMPGCRPRTS